MAKKRGNPGKAAGAGKHVRLDPSVVSMGRMVAGAKGITLTDYLSDLLRPAVSRDYVQVMKRLEKEGGVE
jgi:hypothetical protein